MKSEEFIRKWKAIGDEHIIADQSLQSLFLYGSVAFEFLFIIGMPSEFQELNFDYLKEKQVTTVNHKWELDDIYYEKYLAIGFNGSGDPITLNLENQELVYLNTGNYLEEVFINTDLEKFSLCVLRVDSFFKSFKKLNPDSFFDTEFSDEDFNEVIKDLKEIDCKIFESSLSHWVITLDTYKWERDDERKNTTANKI